jgi:hypothetical protein
MHRVALLLVVGATATWAGDDAGLMKLVMPEARFVAGIHVGQVKKTPFGQFALAEFSASQDPEFDGFVKASGFDPRYNLDEIVIASPGAGSGGRLYAAQGAFSPARILELARSAGAAVDRFQGIDIIGNGAAAAAAPHGTRFAVAFLSGSIAVAGDPAAVRAAIARRTSGGGPGPDLAATVDTVSHASDAWFVSSVPAAELIQDLPGANLGGASLDGALQGDALKSIRQASGGATFGQTVRLSVQLLTQTAGDATSLASALRLLSDVLGSGSQGAPWNSLDLKTEGKLLRVGFSMSEAQLESLLAPEGARHRS